MDTVSDRFGQNLSSRLPIHRGNMRQSGKKEVAKIKGMFQGKPTPEDACNQMANYMFDDKTKSWHNYFGWEIYFTGEPQHSAGGPYPKNGPIWSLYSFSSKNGAKQHILFQQESDLYEVNGSTKKCVQVQPGRKPPAQSDYLTSYTPFGKYVVIADGNNSIVKYRGGNKLFPVGWPEAPGPISPRSPGSNPASLGGGYFFDSSEDYIKRNASGLPVKIESENWPGLGTATKDEKNKYFYKVSFINETGSESPISQQSDAVKWTTTEFAVDGVNTTSRTGVLLSGIPTGPEGVVARKVYRTKNNATTFFYAFTIYDNITQEGVDYLEDDQLGDEAPNPSDSIVMPSQMPRFAASFQNCLFIDGGKKNPSRIFYSNPLQMDSYSASSYFEIGNRQGGDITGLFPYYNNLFVFRERAIDVISGTPGNFQVSPFIQGVGCKSHATIDAVPGVGICFLAEDGIYAIQGNFTGFELNITKLSTPIDLLSETWSRSGMKRAVGQYWPQAKEYHCYIPDSGSDQVGLGIVLHENFGWSVRDGWPVGCCTVDYDGNFIFGHKLGNANQYNTLPSGTAVGNGLMVISGKRQAGYVVSDPSPEKEIIPAPALTSTFRSQWHDMGYDPAKKQIKYLYIYAYTTGQQQVPIRWYRDGDWKAEFDQYAVNPSTSMVQEQSYLWERPDYPDQPNYITIPAGAPVPAESAIWDTSVWQDRYLTSIRVAVPLFMCSTFAFEIETTSKIQFVGYAVEYTATPTQTIRGKS